VIFALRRLREGGCILTDEVGLGKTIEAGLVIPQSRAEGAERVLLIVPKSLIGQWQHELLNLFGISAREQRTDFRTPGVYLVGREFAGSEPGAEALGAAPPFDLVVIDEAHEIFAGLHKRYGADGLYDDTADERSWRTASAASCGRRRFCFSRPRPCRTRWPSSGAWFSTWSRRARCSATSRRSAACSLRPTTARSSRARSTSCSAAWGWSCSARCAARPRILDRPFTQRSCRLYEYKMSDDERSLYEDVTDYLLRPSLYAFAGAQRRLLLIGFHKRMASSIPALAASLENVAARLRRLSAGQGRTTWLWRCRHVSLATHGFESGASMAARSISKGTRRTSQSPVMPPWPGG
jgi:hypothetical protein